VDATWVAATADRVLAAAEERRSTWQSWHVRAEAQRCVRAAEVPADLVDQLVDRLVAEVLNIRSASLARPEDGIAEPMALRRSDGLSVYTDSTHSREKRWSKRVIKRKDDLEQDYFE
jgi:hypothetical protein